MSIHDVNTWEITAPFPSNKQKTIEAPDEVKKIEEQSSSLSTIVSGKQCLKQKLIYLYKEECAKLRLRNLATCSRAQENTGMRATVKQISIKGS